MKPTPIERFLSKIISDPNTGCWLWTGEINRGGYSLFKVDGSRVRAHRWIYEYCYGPIPEGLQIDHVYAQGCRYRHCVNPLHLEAVTPAENIRRGRAGIVNRIKTHCPQGHPYDEQNTYIYRGNRYCRVCKNKYANEATRRRRDRDKVPS